MDRTIKGRAILSARPRHFCNNALVSLQQMDRTNGSYVIALSHCVLEESNKDQ
ncbi:hypothetical protein HAX54_053301, partial [Datura stramonium]|nr:hypothetical protein [Datura stramonium]